MAYNWQPRPMRWDWSTQRRRGIHLLPTRTPWAGEPQRDMDTTVVWDRTLVHRWSLHPRMFWSARG